MARFYADIQGNRGQATRMGTAKSGMIAHIRGWEVGAKVIMDVNKYGEDTCTVYLTSGSNGLGPGRFLGTFTAKDAE